MFINIFIMKIIATGMILHPTNSSITRSNEEQYTMFNAQSTKNPPMTNDSFSSASNNHNSNSVSNFDVDDDDNTNERKAAIKNRPKFHLRKPTLLSKLKSDLKSRSLSKVCLFICLYIMNFMYSIVYSINTSVEVVKTILQSLGYVNLVHNPLLP
ncbi:unnamed protein product [Schistosoma curassoni]|uniref:Pv-fam-d protein n=1 Tax=Schistosoma curassoni TaxID=6186 RepID=A0A183JBT0_9TREM|nr:unnamed protein product [Schistosoma curassoni]